MSFRFLSIAFLTTFFWCTQTLSFSSQQSLPLKKAIFNGQYTTLGSKSWQSVVKLYILDKEDNYYSCTGTFISSRKILTAAHCLTGGKHLDSLYFYKGAQHFQTVFIEKKEQEIRINSDYYSFSSDVNSSDVATIELQRNILPKTHRPMALISAQHISSFNDLYNTNVYQVGTSDLDMDGLAYSKGKVNFINDMIIVSGLKNSGACQGDSGGPLVMSYESELIVLGVLSGVIPNDSKVCGGTLHVAPISLENSNFIKSIDL